MRVLIAEDSKIQREYLRAIIEQYKDGKYIYHIRAELANVANVPLACSNGAVDLLLMDICTNGTESGLSVAQKVKQLNSKIKIIMMTAMPEYSFLERARKIGCESFWYKEGKESNILEIMDLTMQGIQVYPLNMPVIKIGNAKSRDFTKRELDVLKEVAKRDTQEEVANNLGITINTLKSHLKSIRGKTGYKTTSQVLAEMTEKGFILPHS